MSQVFGQRVLTSQELIDSIICWNASSIKHVDTSKREKKKA
ncbi:hypothetical protein Ngar_c25700 [Candidatus Nitrososphaera gargensis Ga9.2]|uniref:Transposase n=1 Tax=Nitrososphaera gargensis (strain Ga9.2) TaxID=1237085 RepID=K0ILI0_NITGG|nr:hypothetical protein Ngar_c25700 [Candidatus Nitrososphaera gargensis Ga9.2]